LPLFIINQIYLAVINNYIAFSARDQFRSNYNNVNSENTNENPQIQTNNTSVNAYKVNQLNLGDNTIGLKN
jgi:hypothetical protein